MLGCVDAFISHSWSDDPEAKYQTLRAWALEFNANHGRDPLVWLGTT